MGPGPGQIDLAIAHGVVGALHAERADIDMGDDDGDQHHADRGMDILRDLHALDVQHREGEEHQEAADRQGEAAQRHRPEDHLLTRVEAMRRRMLVADEAAEFADPANVGAARQIVLDPHDDHEDEADHERPGDEIVDVFGPVAPRREGFGSDQRKQQPLAEDVVETGDRQEDEGGGRHPVVQPLEEAEAQQLAADLRAVLDHDPAAREVEGGKRKDHADDGDGADPRQPAFMEALVIAPLGLLEHRGLAVRNADPAADLAALQRVEELLFGRRLGGGVLAAGIGLRAVGRGDVALGREVVVALLGNNGRRQEGEREAAGGEDGAKRGHRRHLRPRSFRDRPSASPRPRCRSRAWRPAPCRSSR